MQSTVEAFIAKWQGVEGGQERANYALFLTELCDVLGEPHPDGASATHSGNDYVFERVVREETRDGRVSDKRIDLYKRDCFVLEAKQSRQVGDKKLSDAPPLPGIDGAANEPLRGRRVSANRAWDVLMMNARAQAENYVRLLPAAHEPPPFVMVCDVGHCIEIYANFRRDGKAYDQFPDRRSFRIYLEDLREESVRARLKAIWSDPMALDPSRHAARVTREIAERIAKVSQALEKAGHPPEDVAMFLMRVLFTMFAEDVGLLPPESFRALLKDCAEKPEIFPGMMEDLWRAMDEGGFTATIREKVKQFNGAFFKDRRALKLAREEIGELAAAAAYDWKDVEPAIFGTFLEQALDPGERRKLGAHYTPRAYVERLVVATVIDPLQADWDNALATIERQKAEGRNDAAVKTAQAFHDRLCETLVLDPACGTGNFLYVSLELMKKLEGKVLEVVADLGGQVSLALDRHTVDPHQFLGLEINPRAAAIAELVLWIGHLQWHFKNQGVAPTEPILKQFRNIRQMDAVLTWDGYPLPQVVDGKETYPNPRRPDWPKADYIVGNPPFVGKGEPMRSALGDAKLKALWQANRHLDEGNDFVMYWWDRAAEILLRPKSDLKRFGFVTTNSISQMFNRRVMQPHLNAKRPLSLIMAVPDHPWTKVTKDSAAVRIAMTVAEAGKHDGRLLEIIAEEAVETDSPIISFKEKIGRINSDLTVGTDITVAKELRCFLSVSSNGMMIAGSGFLLNKFNSEKLKEKNKNYNKYVKKYRNGRDLTSRPRELEIIDLYGLEIEEVRMRLPDIYQYILTHVKPERDLKADRGFREKWWVFGRPRTEIRPAIEGINRYIATVETARHRLFQFLEAEIIPDHKLVVIADDAAHTMGYLSSKFHVTWSLRAGSWLGVGNDSVYVKSRCLHTFPFPDASEAQKQTIGAIAEELDAHRKRVLAEHAHLTLTGLYNVLERLKTGARPDELTDKERVTYDDGLVLILKELHERLDVAVAEAYGWPADLSEDDVLERLVALNKERAREEARGHVRWLRPDYQIPRFGTEAEKAELELDLGPVEAAAAASGPKPAFPKSDTDQTLAVVWALMDADGPLSADDIAARFRKSKTLRPSIAAVLASLHRMGRVSWQDGRYALRLAA